jgi:hypothetical protein
MRDITHKVVILSGVWPAPSLGHTELKDPRHRLSLHGCRKEFSPPRPDLDNQPPALLWWDLELCRSATLPVATEVERQNIQPRRHQAVSR